MGWIKVTNGKMTISVTEQSYKDIFGKDGFRVVLENDNNNLPHYSEISEIKEPIKERKRNKRSTIKTENATEKDI